MNTFDVAVIGAGPYGLSIAAHLKAQGIATATFGVPMQVWRERMPDGMILKSDGFASSLSDPAGTFTLRAFCESTGTPYDDTRIPVQIDTFRAYGLAFQQRFVPDLDERLVTSLEARPGCFVLGFGSGPSVAARRVVLAVGISHFEYVPPALAALPASVLSHSSAHRDPAKLRNHDVTVLGAGASAVDLAVLLKEAGARVTLVARRQRLKFHTPPSAAGPSLWEAMRRPSSPIGPGWRSRLYSDFPTAFRRLPPSLRFHVVKTFAGPSTGWPMKARFAGVDTRLGVEIERADAVGGGLRLTLAGAGKATIHETEHMIAATGYQVEVRRLPFLSDDLLTRIRTVEDKPVLSSTFESSVPGLYFVGAASASCFGPVMRFACGAEWAARHLTRSLIRSRTASSVPSVVEALAR
jgi:thioredoxin reductase